MAIDISEYLRVIKNGKTVNEVRSGISGAVTVLKEYLNADDIDQELYEIEHGVYGKDIRGAIYSALDKLSKKEGGGGEKEISIYIDWRPVISNVLTGFVTDNWEEVINNGN